MTFEEYIPLANKTEALIPKEKPYHVAELADTFQLLVYVGMLLDLHKKKLFYNREIDLEKRWTALRGIETFFAAIQKGNYDADTPLECDTRLLHAVIGKATEIAELSVQVINDLHGLEMDVTNIKEELGDDKWYDAIIFNRFGWTMSQILSGNINKLKKRYPDGFNEVAAVNRNVAAELAELDDAAILRQRLTDYLAKHQISTDTHFYTPAEWAARNEKVGNRAKLTLTAEGSFYAFFNTLHGEAALQMVSEFNSIVAECGFWYEQGFAWSWHFYPIQQSMRGLRPWEKPGFDVWGEDPKYPRADWTYTVNDGNTNLGYWEWVDHQKESE